MHVACVVFRHHVTARAAADTWPADKNTPPLVRTNVMKVSLVVACLAYKIIIVRPHPCAARAPRTAASDALSASQSVVRRPPSPWSLRAPRFSRGTCCWARGPRRCRPTRRPPRSPSPGPPAPSPPDSQQPPPPAKQSESALSKRWETIIFKNISIFENLT